MTRYTPAEDERRTWLNHYRGAQDALTALKLLHPDKDFTGALRDCQKRIQELSQEQTR